MKKLLTGVAVLAAVAFAAQSSGAKHNNSDVGITSTGGPDAYGYTWIDSRESGGPTYNWIDISGIGTQLTDLGDDGSVGPFGLGFDFPYYWYTTNKIWLQFNGALSLSTPTGMYHPGTTDLIPSPVAPNDLIVYMGADLDYTTGGHAYFWTNGTDTAIIQVDSVQEWADTLSYHSAEVILFLDASNNGHILVQYGPQNGDFDNNQGTITSAIGIEDITGNVGLQFMRANTPAGNIPFDGLAVLYTRPDSSNYRVFDVGVDMLWHEDHQGFFLHYWPDTINTPLLRAKNFGSQPFNNFKAIVTIRNEYGSTVYIDTVDGGALDPGDTVTLSFKTFNARDLGQGIYSLNGRVILQDTSDMNPGNNTVENVEFRIVDNYTPWLGWDSDQSEISFTWWIGGAGGDAGWGARFPLPYDFHADSVVAYAGSSMGAGGQVRVALLDDNGSGMPGDTIVISGNINIPNDGAIHTAKVVVNQDFSGGDVLYGALFQMTDSTGCGVDDMTPYSRNFLEYTGTWAPYRDREANDAYIRLYGHFTVDVAETGKPGAFTLKSVGPIPTRDKTVFSFFIPARGDVGVSIYNAMGQRVMARTETFEAGPGTMAFDLSRLSDGVYIYRLNYADTRLTGKLVITK